MAESRDIRDDIFRSLPRVRVAAVLAAEQDGIIAQVTMAAGAARDLGLGVDVLAKDGARVTAGQAILRVTGSPKAVVMAEDLLIGMIAKPSGVCTAAHAAMRAAGGRVEIVAGAWKKLPLEIRRSCRGAAAQAGIRTRISERPFIYLDKNYVRIFGGVAPALAAVKDLEGYLRVIQVKGETAPVAQEALTAARAGAEIVMVDTGRAEDLRIVHRCLAENGVRNLVKLAFGGGIRIEHIEALIAAGADILDIGAAVVDAPMLGLKFDVCGVTAGQAPETVQMAHGIQEERSACS